MNTPVFVTALIVGLMLAELRRSRANERRLVAEGAVRPDGDVYLWIATLYPAAFLAMGVEGAWRAGHVSAAAAAGVVAGQREPAWVVSGALLFAAGKWLKYWAIRTLGDRWSFRVFVLPGKPLVGTGPYRYVRHPNYIGLIGELAGAAMMDGAVISGPVSVVLFGVALWRRIVFEERVLGR